MPRHGENIRKRPDGRWEGRYRVPDPKTGKQSSRSVYARTYAEVKEKLDAAKQKIPGYDIGAKEGEDIPYTDFQILISEWLQSVEVSKKYATLVKYRLICKKYLIPILRDGGICSVDLCRFKEFFMKKMEQEQNDMSDSLRKSIFCVVNQIFTYSTLHYDTPDMHITFQKRYVGNKPVEILSHTEQSILFRFLCQDISNDKLGIIICLFTGLRLGEICSLKWEDIDIKERILRVNSTVQRISVSGQKNRTALLEGAPKSVFSHREIPVSDDLIALLMPFYGKGIYVVGGRKPMEPRLYQYKFQGYLSSAGINPKNFHIIRHTFATNCINNGTDIKSLSEILGHSDVSITLNRYVHPTIATKRRYMDSLSSVYGQLLSQKS